MSDEPNEMWTKLMLKQIEEALTNAQQAIADGEYATAAIHVDAALQDTKTLTGE